MNLPIHLHSRWSGKRFNSLNRVVRDRFSARVYKIGLRLDFTCPNRDGKVAVGGCVYCNNASHTAQDYRPRTSVTAQLEQGALALHKRQLRICTHLILGFPGESRAEILATPALLNRLGIDGVKLHNLHVIKNTQREQFYKLGQVPLCSREEYVNLMIDFVERLDPEMVMHRLSGEAQRAITVAPEWSVDKRGVHNAIVKAFDARDTWQGRLFSLNQETNPTGSAWSQGATL
jgi:radical SAM superfamily enzyme